MHWSTRLALGIWCVLLAGVFGRVAFSNVGAQSVVPIYLAAGERWLASEPLYPPITGFDLYRNPPVFAAMFAPISLLPGKLAVLLWRAFCIGVYALGLRSLLRDVIPNLSSIQRNLLWSIAGLLVLPAFNNGQANLLIVGAALLGVGHGVAERHWRAAFWLALAAIIKVYPVAIGLLGLVVAPRTFGWRFLAVLAGFLILPFALQSPDYAWQAHVDYLAELAIDDRTVSYVQLVRAPRDWTILLRWWFDIAVPRSVTQPIALASAAVLASWMLKLRVNSQSAWLAALQFGLLWIVLCGPATEHNTYALLAPVAAIGCILPHSRWLRALGWCASFGFLANIVRASFPPDAVFKMIEVPTVAALALAAIAVVESLRPQRSSAAIRVESHRLERDLHRVSPSPLGVP